MVSTAVREGRLDQLLPLLADADGNTGLLETAQEVSTLIYSDGELDTLFSAACWCGDDAAAFWLHRCAKLHCPVALACMALMFHKGCRTFYVDPERAAHLGRRAFTCGLERLALDRPFAQYLLGALIWHGVGTPANKGLGLHLIAEAAQTGVASAQHALGRLHELHGDIAAALQCYERATAQNHTQGTLHAGLLLLRSDDFARYQEGAQRVYNAASRGDVLALRCLGQLHQQQGNEDEALRLYAMAAHHSRGDAVAPYWIGLIHEAQACG